MKNRSGRKWALLPALALALALCACGKPAATEPQFSPEEVVRKWYLSQTDDDWTRLDSTMLRPGDHPAEPPSYGLIGVVIRDIREYRGERFAEQAAMWIESEAGKDWGLTSPDDLAIVLADAQILYDSRLVGIPDSGESCFYLVRQDADSPWKIATCGAGSLTYSQEFGGGEENGDKSAAAQPEESATLSPYARAAVAELAALRKSELTTDERSIRRTVECYIRVLEDQMLHYDTAEFDYAGVFFDPDSAEPDSLSFAAGKSLLRRRQWQENGLRVLWSDVDVEITAVEIDGDTATAEAGASLRYILEGQEPTISGEGTAYSFTLTKRDGAWRISSIAADSEIDRYYDLEALRKALG